MKNAILFVSLIASPLCVAQGFDAQSYNEPFRPQYHFSPAKNWTNDPNGLVFYKGEYHLFYQYNPFGDVWGHMSWGHAVSPDLVHWQHLPVALAEENGIMIFSGSAVVDRNNSSGLCAGTDCLVAIYTGHTDTLQTQNIAFSNDRGRTWTKYKGNPVIDLHMKDFRDPKVFWHDPSHRWIMVVSLPKEHKVRFFTSHDLKQWTPLSDFGPAGSTKGDWECPDLYPLQEGRWMLSININPGAPLGGSGNQYFVGRFDGTKFTNDNPMSTTLWADYGKDFYASTSFNDIPASDGRRIWIGWMSNWQYARDEPTSPFRCIQSIPRVLKLKSMPEGIRLIQEPVAELQSLRTDPIHIANSTIADANAKLRDFHSDSCEIVARFDGNAAFHLRKGSLEETIVGYDGQLFVDRRKSGNTNFSKDFPGIHRAPLAGPPVLHIFVDRSSLEVFGGSGEAVISDRIFPSPQSTGLELSGAGKVISLDIWKLKSIWR